MLTRTSAFLGIQRGAVLELARSVVSRRQFCQDAPPNSGEPRQSRDFNAQKQYTVDSFAHILKSEDERKKVHLILLEIASLHEDTGRAPTEIKDRDIRDLLIQSSFQRTKYYDYMFKREMATRNDKVKKAKAREKQDEKRQGGPTDPPDGLFPFIRKPQMFRQTQGKALMEAALFGQKLVIDFSYDQHMTNRERRNLAEQVQLLYAVNKTYPSPFDLTFCNIEKGSFTEELLHDYFATSDLGTMLLETTDKSYLDLYPKRDLIYLSPDAPQSLREWDHDSVFIIGGLVDLGAERPLSLAKAKREGIACARLPIQEHVVLRQGAQKTLTLNNVVEILLTMKTENDWRLALEKLPRRYIADLGQSLSLQRRRVGHSQRWRAFDQRG